MSEETSYHPLYLQGIEYFNECEFFEAHDVWEELWADTSGDDRRFYQGLIQVAVCLHHFGNENTRGAIKLYHGCQGYLKDYAPHYLGLNVERLLAELTECCAKIVASDEEYPSDAIEVDLIPEIHLDPPPQ